MGLSERRELLPRKLWFEVDILGLDHLAASVRIRPGIRNRSEAVQLSRTKNERNREVHRAKYSTQCSAQSKGPCSTEHGSYCPAVVTNQDSWA